MASVPDLDRAAHIQMRAGIIVFCGNGSKRNIRVYPCQQRSCPLKAGCVFGDLGAHLGEQLVFK